MAPETRIDRVSFITLRFMRRPILVLVTSYAVSIGGMVIIPGPIVDGEPTYLSIFHAFYFLTYTATTTGFGEIPYAFSDAQRMWAMVSLYASVIAWIYALGSILRLMQNPHFQQAVAEWRFTRRVDRISEPFVIICGFGNTGSLLARGLSDAGITGVVIDRDEERIKALGLRDYRVTMPGLSGNARDPQSLIDAGLTKPNCRAVVALTSEERVNQKIAVTSALLNPEARVITLSTSQSYREVLAALSTRSHVIDPFHTFARFLAASIQRPELHMLNAWLLGSPGATLDRPVSAPRGRWILCGYGRMGRYIHEVLKAARIETVIIETELHEEEQGLVNLVAGRATKATLMKAGIKTAAGIVAGTNNDYDNLAIIVTARALNPEIYTVVRQNRHENAVVFSTARADLIMQPSMVSARRVLLILIAPLLRTLFEAARAAEGPARDRLLGDVITQLRTRVGGTDPKLWTVEIDERSAPAVLRRIQAGGEVRLDHLLGDPDTRHGALPCVPLASRSGEEVTVMPGGAHLVRPGDEILLCGTRAAAYTIEATLNAPYTLDYLCEGTDQPLGYVTRWLANRRRPQPHEA